MEFFIFLLLEAVCLHVRLFLLLAIRGNRYRRKDNRRILLDLSFCFQREQSPNVSFCVWFSVGGGGQPLWCLTWWRFLLWLLRCDKGQEASSLAKCLIFILFCCAFLLVVSPTCRMVSCSRRRSCTTQHIHEWLLPDQCSWIFWDARDGCCRSNVTYAFKILNILLSCNLTRALPDQWSWIFWDAKSWSLQRQRYIRVQNEYSAFSIYWT